MHKRVRRADVDVDPRWVKAVKHISTSPPPRPTIEEEEKVVAKEEMGDGTPAFPFHLSLRQKANKSGCMHCAECSCQCLRFSEELRRCYASLPLKRETERLKRRELCAKSILPPFVSRMVRIAHVGPQDTFYDLGCGNGSVLFQVAALTGARCVGVEINSHNAELARAAWAKLRPVLEKRYRRKISVEILCDDFCELLRDATFFRAPCVVWAANLLLPRPVNHFLSERFRSLPLGTRVLCFEDLYPHSRSLSRIRDPEAFEKFDMYDYEWQPESVEWCTQAGPFFMYVKKA